MLGHMMGSISFKNRGRHVAQWRQGLAAFLESASGRALLFQRQCYEVQKNSPFLSWLQHCRMTSLPVRATCADAIDEGSTNEARQLHLVCGAGEWP